MNDVYYSPDAVKQDELGLHVDNIKDGRTSEDLLFQVMLDWGLELSYPIEEETICKKTVFFVDGNALSACFEMDVNEAMIKEIAKRKPLRAVFRDNSYSDDSVKINVDQIFKLLSPGTEVRSI
jgi:adenine-specific DNA-methyltransferase